MKNRILLLCVCVMTLAQAKALDAGYSYSVYHNGETPYIEINIEIAAASIYFEKVDSLNYVGEVEILMLFKQGDRVANYEKFVLISPVLSAPKNLLDVKRFAIENGVYEVELTFIDTKNRENKREITFPLTVDIGTKPYLSEIQLLRSFKPDQSESPFTKNGYYLEPLPFRFYNKHASKVAFYVEIYHSDLFTKEPYLVRYFIEEISGNQYTRLAAVGSQRKAPSEIDAVLAQMVITDLQSGTYRLVVEIRDNANAIVCKRSIEFQRSNPPTEPFIAGKITEEQLANQFVETLTAEELVFALRAIRPMVPQSESEALVQILQEKDPKSMRFFLFSHFARNNPLEPESAYLRYMEVAKAVDKLYNSAFGYGFETDRGIIFMKNGKPDDIVKVTDEPTAPPYEIWVYYNYPATKQTNVKFLFYNQSLSPNDYSLLHSTARNERNNPRWEVELYGKNPTQIDTNDGGNTMESNRMLSNIGRNARAIFDDL